MAFIFSQRLETLSKVKTRERNVLQNITRLLLLSAQPFLENREGKENAVKGVWSGEIFTQHL